VLEGGLHHGSCNRRHAVLPCARRWQTLPEGGQSQGSCNRRNTALLCARQGQALPARRLLHARRQRSRQHALHTVSGGGT
jgi:hypothetical protein